MPTDFQKWIEIHSRPGMHWYGKRLSGTDTLATGHHQAGPPVPKQLLSTVFPALNILEERNPDTRFDLYIDSHDDHRQVRAVWYDNKLHSGSRNEARITGLGGPASALLDPESTGALAIFVFSEATPDRKPECHVWVCRNVPEETLMEDRIGPIDPSVTFQFISA